MKHTTNGTAAEERKKILVVEDNELNREILASILEAEYDVIPAENGAEGLDLLERHYKELSLVILDVYMPVCDGFEFLAKVSEKKEMTTVPVIVATGSDNPEDETRCLQLGAVDFIMKPYNPAVVRSRVNSMVRFRESVATLSVVERDELTGLYTMQAFYYHMGKAITRQKSDNYTLLVADIHNFKLITSVFGKQKAEETLCFIGDKIKNNAVNGICARDDDTFFMFLPGIDAIDPTIFDNRYPLVYTNAPVPNLQLVIGIYEKIDITQPPMVLCSRVIMALEEAKNAIGRKVAFYDESIHKQLAESHVIESSFPEAIEQHQFHAYYQPKVNAGRQAETAAQSGEVVGAEALVRWIRPDGTMLPPYKFIPLIERNGQIAILDEYMFREVCLFQKERIRAGKKVVPISVNLSRNSIYQNNALDRYRQIARENGIPLELVPIELTESAMIEGETIITLTDRFVEAGFSLHMDDFGTGASSLSSLTTMPFHVIKMDKSLTDRIGTPKGDILIEYLIMIAHKIGGHVVAEGVETKEQVEFLRGVDCDVIQGYYYYPPKCRSDFESILDS